MWSSTEAHPGSLLSQLAGGALPVSTNASCTLRAVMRHNATLAEELCRAVSCTDERARAAYAFPTWHDGRALGRWQAHLLATRSRRARYSSSRHTRQARTPAVAALRDTSSADWQPVQSMCSCSCGTHAGDTEGRGLAPPARHHCTCAHARVHAQPFAAAATLPLACVVCRCGLTAAGRVQALQHASGAAAS